MLPSTSTRSPRPARVQATTVGLVLVSTVSHAWWNLLLKRSNGGATFIGLSKVAEVVLFAPALLLYPAPVLLGVLSEWPRIVVATLLTLANYTALDRAYRAGDLSFVYPIARGGALLFLPLLAFPVLGERLSTWGAVAIGLIVAGIAVLPLASLSYRALSALVPRLRGRATLWALAAALTTAAYTVWDARAVRTLPAFAYFYAYTVMVAASYALFLLRRVGVRTLRTEWRTHRWPIVQVGVCNVVTYLLVLLALRSGPSSGVVALRQLGIVVGAFLGWRLLG
ncbi:MAG TPA: EamA family transporter, partial [Gemmatimonadales bacterium]|nr:EamA family transporter [Gemmatimonadales bacterium]